LRVLQYKEIERVSGTKTIPLDIRIIASTNRNLEEMVRANQFREDLWFRLNVFPIWIPPLRERKTDIPALIPLILHNI
jgi:Nif-specific regulatory protein